MPIFHLWPEDDDLEHRDWIASDYKGHCRVSANSEADARDIAAHGFGKAQSRPAPDREFASSPWLNPDLVRCRPVAHVAGDAPPRGMITMPPESGRPSFMAPGFQ